MSVEFDGSAAKLVTTTHNVTYVGFNLQDTIVRSDNSATQFNSLVLNGRDIDNEDSAQFYGNTTNLTVDGFAPKAPIPMIGSIYGGYTNNTEKNFYLNNPNANMSQVLQDGKNFYIHVNIDFIFNIDVTDCNIGVYCGTLGLQAETSYNFRVNDIWKCLRTTEQEGYLPPDEVWDNTNTIFKVRKYGYMFNEYQEIVPIAGEYNKTLFIKDKTDITMTEADSLAVVGVVLQLSADVDYTWELDCSNNDLNLVYHYIHAKLSSFDTLGGVETFALNDFLLRDGTKFKTEQIRAGEGIKLINYLGEATQFAKDDGTYYILPHFINITAPNLIEDTRIQLYNITKDIELDNSLVGTNGYKYTTELGIDFNIEVDDIIKLRACWQSGTTAKLPLQITSVVNNIGTIFIDTQEDDIFHNQLGYDGKLIDLDASPDTGEIKADFANIQIDANDSDNVFDCRKGIAWFRYICTTEMGIRVYNPEALIYNPDTRNILVDGSIQLDNVKTTALKVTEGLWLRKDGGEIIAPTSNTVVWVPNDRVYQGPETGTSGLTPSESNKLMGLNTTNLDVPVSSRATKQDVFNAAMI